MARRPSFYKKAGWYVTSFGGIQHRKLCRIEEGERNAQIQLARLLVKTEDGPKPLKKGGIATVSEAHDDFLDAKHVEAATGTYEFYRVGLKMFHEMFGRRELKSLTYNDGVQYKKALIDAGLKTNTINSRLQVAKGLLNWASAPSRQQQYLLTSNPFSELKRYPVKSRERIITDDEFQAVLQAMVKHGNRSVDGSTEAAHEAFGLLRLTTMRPQELRFLRWEYIRWAEHRVVFPLQFIKTRTRREVTLTDSAEELLRNRAERLKSHGNDVSEGYVFFYPARVGARRTANIYSGQILSASAFSSKWRRAIKAAVKAKTIQETTDVGTLVPYSFRHTRITELVMEGHQFPVIMSEAGHASPKTTLRYVHLASSHVTESIREADKKKKKDGEK